MYGGLGMVLKGLVFGGRIEDARPRQEQRIVCPQSHSILSPKLSPNPQPLAMQGCA